MSISSISPALTTLNRSAVAAHAMSLRPGAEISQMAQVQADNSTVRARRAAATNVVEPAAQKLTSATTHEPAASNVKLTTDAQALLERLASEDAAALTKGQSLSDEAIAFLREHFPSEPGSEPVESSGGQPMLTVEGLMAAWGQSDSPYDINGDGVVDVSDLLALLAAGGTMPMPNDAAPPPSLTVEGLMAAWGTDDPMFDLNGDGVVDVSDLLILLAQLGEDAQPGDPPGVLTVAGLMEAWGQSDSVYDLNGDGVVDVSDLLLLLDAGGTMPAPEPEPELTVEGLLAAWGTNNPMYDLTGSGVVDVSDLLMLLGMLNEGQT